MTDHSTSSSNDDQDLPHFHPALHQQERRRLLSVDTSARDITARQPFGEKQQQKQHSSIIADKRTLVVYSGPTSLDRTIGKNDIYLTNFDYFLKHGIECGARRPENIEYIIVLTQEVADRYTAEDGLITQRQMECSTGSRDNKNNAIPNDNSHLTVLVREDKCYDMESILLVLRTIDVPHLYDHFVYINCGLAGPKFGPGSTPHWETLSSWTELYTSLLSDKVQMVGHTINTHFNTVYSPHIQSFLFAVNTDMIDIWLETGAIYDCGISNEDFKDDILRMALVWRYEVGISRVLLERGYSVAAAFMNQGGKIGVPLIIDANSTYGRNLSEEEVLKSDVFKEDGLRMLTASSFPEYNDYRKYDILPWDCYVFFKVSRLVPHDIQHIMHYENLGMVPLVPNDARLSSSKEWKRKAGVSFLGRWLKFPFPTTSGGLRCQYGHYYCEFELIVVVTITVLLMWYITAMKKVERRLYLQRLRKLRRKWK